PAQLATDRDIITQLPPVTNAVTVGAINATGGSGGGGAVNIAAAQPTIVGNSGEIDIIDGSVQPGSSSFSYTNVWNGTVTLGGAINANSIDVVSGHGITVSAANTANAGIALTTYGGGTIGGAGSISSTGPILLNLGT